MIDNKKSDDMEGIPRLERRIVVQGTVILEAGP